MYARPHYWEDENEMRVESSVEMHLLEGHQKQKQAVSKANCCISNFRKIPTFRRGFVSSVFFSTGTKKRIKYGAADINVVANKALIIRIIVIYILPIRLPSSIDQFCLPRSLQHDIEPCLAIARWS